MKLAEKDVRAMVDILGAVLTLSSGSAEKRRSLMTGLCALITADVWIWGLARQEDPAKQHYYASVMDGGASDEIRAKCMQALEHPQMTEFIFSFFLETKKKRVHLTRLRQQIVDDGRFVNSAAHEAWKQAGIGSLIFSQRPLDEHSHSTVGIYRRDHRSKFTAREAQLAHIILSGVPWLHEQGWTVDRGDKVPVLSKRERLTLNFLTMGKSRKEIAKQMDISIHTVHGYIKEVYRHFRVNSQVELMKLFFRGNGDMARISAPGKLGKKRKGS